MATEKIIQSRLVNKHDIEANWNRAETFVPKQGEIIVYDIDNNYNYERFKVGDGKTLVGNLPFYLEHELDAAIAHIEFLAENMLDATYNDGTLSITKGITLP